MLVLVVSTPAAAQTPDPAAPRWTEADSIRGEVLLDSLRARRARYEGQRNQPTGSSFARKVEVASLVLASSGALSTLAYLENGDRWLGGVDAGLGTLGLLSSESSGGLTLPARLIWGAGFGAMAAWQFNEGDELSEGRRFWYHAAAMTSTIALTGLVEWLVTRNREPEPTPSTLIQPQRPRARPRPRRR